MKRLTGSTRTRNGSAAFGERFGQQVSDVNQQGEQPTQHADEHGSEHDAGDETEDPGPRVTRRGRDQDHHARGGAILNLGKRESGTERLEQAVAAFTEALKERTRERVPPSTGSRRRAILAEPKRGKADRRDVDAFSATPGPETTAKFRRVAPGERIIHDNDGRDTGTVAEAFTSIEGIELLVRSARVVPVDGAADDWRPAILKSAL